MRFDPSGISSAHASTTARATINFQRPAAIDFGLWPELDGQVALTFALFFLLDPDVEIALHFTHEHFAVVALSPHQEIAKVLNFIFAVRDRYVFARPRHIDI